MSIYASETWYIDSMSLITAGNLKYFQSIIVFIMLKQLHFVVVDQRWHLKEKTLHFNYNFSKFFLAATYSGNNHQSVTLFLQLVSSWFAAPTDTSISQWDNWYLFIYFVIFSGMQQLLRHFFTPPATPQALLSKPSEFCEPTFWKPCPRPTIEVLLWHVKKYCWKYYEAHSK